MFCRALQHARDAVLARSNGHDVDIDRVLLGVVDAAALTGDAQLRDEVTQLYRWWFIATYDLDTARAGEAAEQTRRGFRRLADRCAAASRAVRHLSSAETR